MARVFQHRDLQRLARGSTVTKVLRYGAVAGASNSPDTFSVTKKVEGDLPEAAKDLDYTLEITLKEHR